MVVFHDYGSPGTRPDILRSKAVPSSNQNPGSNQTRAPRSNEEPRFGTLAMVTYGLVFLTLALSIAAYFFMSRQATSQNAVKLENTRTVQVGAVWIPAYPGAAFRDKASQVNGNTTEGSLDFRSADPAAQVVAFFGDTFQRMGYTTTVATNNVGGGTVQAFRHGGRMHAFVTVESSREGAQGHITTLYRDERQ